MRCYLLPNKPKTPPTENNNKIYWTKTIILYLKFGWILVSKILEVNTENFVGHVNVHTEKTHPDQCFVHKSELFIFFCNLWNMIFLFENICVWKLWKSGFDFVKKNSLPSIHQIWKYFLSVCVTELKRGIHSIKYRFQNTKAKSIWMQFAFFFHSLLFCSPFKSQRGNIRTNS